jgi:hypothetical protein
MQLRAVASGSGSLRQNVRLWIPSSMFRRAASMAIVDRPGRQRRRHAQMD